MTSTQPIAHHRIIAVCGAGTCDTATTALAEEVGRRIAEAGAALVCGGLGGVMEAACRGALAAGGLTIGILPGDDPAAANAAVQVPIASGMGQARNVIIVQTAAVIIAVGGAYGTLSEIALARKSGRPVIGLQSWELGQDAQGHPHIIRAQTAAEAVALAQQVLQQQSP
jgi:hypothetical protein